MLRGGTPTRIGWQRQRIEAQVHNGRRNIQIKRQVGRGRVVQISLQCLLGLGCSGVVPGKDDRRGNMLLSNPRKDRTK